MPRLGINLNNVSGKSEKKLIDLVEGYNNLPEENHVQRIFYLQKIAYLVYNTKNSAIIRWRNQLEDSGLEMHLQRYGIHRDASVFLQGIEFANAIERYSPTQQAQEQSFFAAMNARDKALTASQITPDVIDAYMKANLVIKAHYEMNEELREKVDRHKHFLALSYAKIEAIQGFVEQNFDEYQTRALGGQNNKNYIFRIGEEENGEQLVLRVEDRTSLEDEWLLQTQEVGEYFSEDYATVMVHMEHNGGAAYLPVVVSQFARKGDLEHYAAGLAGKKPEEISQEVQAVFSQLNDFCLKLKAANHYHPDIKLPNFLMDENGHLIVSDRKTIMGNINPLASMLHTTPIFAPPEFNDSKRAYMPSYMSFQLGLALKEFMFKSNGIAFDKEQEDDLAQFLSWSPMSQYFPNPTNDFQNISVLIQELTRPITGDRLSIENFQTLLKQVHLEPTAFMAKLEALAPQEKLSNYEDIQSIKKEFSPSLIDKILAAKSSDPEIAKELASLFAKPHFNTLCKDPRAGLPKEVINKLDQIQNYKAQQIAAVEKAKVVALADHLNQHFRVKHDNPGQDIQKFLHSEPLKRVKEYVYDVEGALRREDFQKAGFLEQFFHLIGVKDVPKRTSVSELGEHLPPMDTITKNCIRLSRAAGNLTFPGLSMEQHSILEDVSRVNVIEDLNASTHDMLEKMKAKASSSQQLEPAAPVQEQSSERSADIVAEKGNKAIKKELRQLKNDAENNNNTNSSHLSM